MTKEKFVETYSHKYALTFHKEETEKIIKIEQSIEDNKIQLSEKISKFLFEPRYKVKNLKFKKII